MFDRRSLLRAGVSLGALAAMFRPRHASAEAKQATFEVTKTDAEWRKLLTSQQFYVLRSHGTERAFTSPLDKEHRAGTFSCAGCDLPLFSSTTKFDSRTGWPSFHTPLENAVGDDRRPQFLHDAHRGALPPLRRPPGPRVQRRAAAHGSALLHERRGDEVRARGCVVCQC